MARQTSALALITFAIAIVTLILYLQGCRSCPSPPVAAPLPEVRIVKTLSRCLDRPPPSAPAYAPVPSTDQRCVFWACFEEHEAIALAGYLDELKTWSRTAWARCSSVPPNPEAP